MPWPSSWRAAGGIRGYEQVKHANALAAKESASELLEQLHRPRLPLLAS